MKIAVIGTGHVGSFEAIPRSMRGDVIVDARNLYDPAVVRSLGFRYFGVGQP